MLDSSLKVGLQQGVSEKKNTFCYNFFFFCCEKVFDSKKPLRYAEHAPIFDSETGGTRIGEVTSGTMSPSLQKSLGMCYVDVPFNKLKSRVWVEVRGKRHPIVISKMPFVPHQYKKWEMRSLFGNQIKDWIETIFFGVNLRNSQPKCLKKKNARFVAKKDLIAK